MKKLLSILFLFHATGASASDCHPPSQGFLEGVVRESFHATEGENELREWMRHPKNSEIRNEIKALDRRSKFNTRLKREELLAESQIKYETAILNNERPADIEHFPVVGAHSKMTASLGALTLEMSNLSKDDLSVIPKEILDKLDSKVKINYELPYDKFEYLLTYDGKELPMNKALGKVQEDMEKACELREIDNDEYRRWYQKTNGGDGKGRYGGTSSGAGGGSGKGGSGQ